MNCAVHPDVEAAGYCRNCGKAMCKVCMRPVADVLYCEDCLALALGHTRSPQAAVSSGAPPVATPGSQGEPGGGNPAVAFILGFLFPGLGAVYNGEYNKALIHIVLFATFVLGLSSDMDGGMKAVLGILLAGFIFYMAFDALRTAQARSRGEVLHDPLQSWSKERPIGPVILVAVGAILLLNNFGFLPFYRIERFWPLILIAIGVLMFRKRLSRNG